MARSSFILTTRTPSVNTEMMASSDTLGILRRTLLKRWMYFYKVYPGYCLMRRRSSVAGRPAREPWKLAMKRSHISP